jgi:uncharacterized protein YegJ (DUF2314 family)
MWLFVILVSVLIVTIVTVVVVMLVLRKRNQKENRVISFVALLKEPKTIDPIVLSSAVQRAWGADVGTGDGEGPDGFIASADILTTVMHDGDMVLINSFPQTYVDDPDNVAEKINDLRIRDSFLNHVAWFSVDALGLDADAEDAEIRRWYRKLGKLFAELLDENCLLIFLPENGSAFPIKPESEAALRSADPVGELQSLLDVPVVPIDGDDPEMIRAVDKARQRFPKFEAAFEKKTGECFSIKAPITVGEITEFIWIEVTSIEGERIYGTLANEPHNLGTLRLGSKVSVDRKDLNDWGYVDRDEKFHGGFTVEVITKRMKGS